MVKARTICFLALGAFSLAAKAQTPAKELIKKPITQLESGQDVDVFGPYSVVASKFGYNTGGAIQLFYNDQFVRQYKHDSFQDGNNLGMPETVAMDEHAIVIGAPLFKSTATGQQFGRVEVFKRVYDNNTHYSTSVTQALTEGSSDIETDFGRAVDIQGDWIAVGAPKKGYDGGVKMYQRNWDGTWINRGWLPLPNFDAAPGRFIFPGSTFKNNATFGSDVSIKYSRMIVGAPGVSSFYIYELNGNSWVLKGEYKGTNAAYMGSDVTITENHAIASSSSEIAVYEKHWDGTWRQLQSITYQGVIDDIAAETRHLVVGRASGGTGDGIVEYYELRSHPVNGVWVYDFVLIGKMHVDVNASTKGLQNHKRLGYSVAIQGDVVVAGAHNAKYETVADGAAFRAPFYQMMPVPNQFRTEEGVSETSEGEAASSLSLYPNPATDVVHVAGKGIVHSVSATSAAGMETNLPLSGDKVDVSSLTSGVYTLSITTESGIHKEKLIIY